MDFEIDFIGAGKIHGDMCGVPDWKGAVSKTVICGFDSHHPRQLDREEVFASSLFYPGVV